MKLTSDKANKPASTDIDCLIAEARLETDLERKVAVREEIANLLRQEESLAEAVVWHLIES